MKKAKRIAVIALACASLAAGSELLRVVPPARPIDYNKYETPDLIRLAEVLAQWHRHAEAIEAGKEAMTRRLEPDEDATIRHRMAQSYEFVPDGGPTAKRMYEEVLQLHPAYERNTEIAYRLGELNSSVIMEGTEPNIPRAMQCFEDVLARSERLKTDSQNVHFIALKARMGLSILNCHKGNLTAARTHFEAIYRCPTYGGEPLPTKVFASPKELQSHKAWLAKQISGMKTRIPVKLVAVCIRPQLGESLVKLGHLATEYAQDPNVIGPLRQAIERLSEVDRVADKAIEDLTPRAPIAE
jgi:hypothetical protein